MFNKILTVILVILIVCICLATGYLGYTYYKKYTLNKSAQKYIEEFDTLIVQIAEQKPEDSNISNGGNNVENTVTNNAVKPNNTTPQNKPSNGYVQYSNKFKYKGFPVVGKLEIPAINIQYPVLKESSNAKAIEVSIVKIYGPEINQPGNVVIAGHNYNNGLFFGKNKNLKIGDKIYITDLKGNRVEYTIYNKYYTPESDYSYITRQTNGKRELTLYTCDRTGANRLIICARAE